MVDFSSEGAKLPPETRLDQLKTLEAKKKKELEDELAKKQKELKELEEKKKKEIKDVQDLEGSTLKELQDERRKQIEELEERIKEFRSRPSSLEATVAQERPEERPPPQGTGNIYQGIRAAQQGVDYLLHAEGMSETKRLETQRGLYDMVKFVAEHAGGERADEGAAWNKLQHEVAELKRKGDDPYNYVTRIETVLNALNAYKR